MATAVTGVSAVVTVANRFGELPLSSLASSPAAVGEGRVWLLVSSAVIADRPAVVSLLGFWIVGFAAFAICSARVIAGVAAGGHLFSALCIYCLIGLGRLTRPDAFASVMHVSDYGLSAIIAAWIGVIASVMWRRHPHAAGRALVVVGSLVCAGVGLLFRPDLTFLDTEHLVAYAFGALLASERVRRSLARSPQRLAAAAASLIAAVS
ncbi:MAG TPA: hypothetical protein VMU72_09890 [Gaiellaceae bacterium]|nr:hypothetical protein [Gaiellaceae bacterium]